MDKVTLQNSLINPPVTDRELGPADPQKGESFSTFLQQSVQEVNRMQVEADASIQDLATGRETDIHRTMIAMEKADIGFQLMMQVRNKIINAYEEISRMQI